jgi:hypothetical protein
MPYRRDLSTGVSVWVTDDPPKVVVSGSATGEALHWTEALKGPFLVYSQKSAIKGAELGHGFAYEYLTKVAGALVNVPYGFGASHAQGYTVTHDLIFDSPASRGEGEGTARAVVENEVLKTQLIEQRRALRLASKRNEELSNQHGKLVEQQAKVVDAICDLTAACIAMQSALIGKQEGRVCLHETHKGVVSAVIGDQLEVTYETPDGPIKQIYSRKQFVEHNVPKEGDALDGYVILTRKPVTDLKQDTGVPEEKSGLAPEFRSKSTIGTTRI